MGVYASRWHAFKHYFAHQLRSVETYLEMRQSKHDVNKRVVFLGDSRARAWPAPNDFKASIRFINRGLGFDTSEQTLQRLNHHVIRLRPDVVVLQVGINDFKYLTVKNSSRERIIAEARQNIHQTVNQLVRIGSQVIVTTIFPICFDLWEEVPYRANDFADGLRAVNEFITLLSNRTNVHLLDAHVLLARRNGAVPAKWARDGLHINSDGYEVLNQQLRQMLEALT
jgi:lysophospholipase L1-like esterase